jgi:putative MFS transporter
MLFSKEYWRATLFISGFWFCAVTPYFAIATFADSVLNQYGLAGGLAGGVGLSAVALAGVVVTFLLIEKIGRRALTVPPQWLCAVVLAVIGLWVGAPAIIVLILFLVFSFFNAGYNTLTNVYPGEVLPTEIRGIGTGFAAAVSRVGAGIGTFLHADGCRRRLRWSRSFPVARARNEGQVTHRSRRRILALTRSDNKRLRQG